MYDQVAIKQMIKEQYKSIAAFSAAIGVPRTTINSALDKDLSSLPLSTAIKICDGLGISLSELVSGPDVSGKSMALCSDKELNLLAKYREPGMSEALDKILGLEEKETSD